MDEEVRAISKKQLKKLVLSVAKRVITRHELVEELWKSLPFLPGGTVVPVEPAIASVLLEAYKEACRHVEASPINHRLSAQIEAAKISDALIALGKELAE